MLGAGSMHGFTMLLSSVDDELEALSQPAAEISVLRMQSVALEGSTAGRLLQELIGHLTKSLHLFMDRLMRFEEQCRGGAICRTTMRVMPADICALIGQRFA